MLCWGDMRVPLNLFPVLVSQRGWELALTIAIVTAENEVQGPWPLTPHQLWTVDPDAHVSNHLASSFGGRCAGGSLCRSGFLWVLLNMVLC